MQTQSHPPRASSTRTLPWLEATACAGLALLLIYQGILPAWHHLNTDFPNYYLVARLLHEGYPLDRIFDWVWLQRIKDHWGLDQPLVGFAGLTPFSALPIVPLTLYSAIAAKRIWIILNLLFLAATAELMHRSTSLGRRRIWLLTLLAINPLRTSFLYGQMHILVLLFVALAFYFHRLNRNVACGIFIALAGALKIYPLFFGLYFLWKKQWTVALATCCASLGIVLIGTLWMGSSVVHIYATQILPRSLQGEVIDPYNIHLASAAALFHRLFLFEPALNPTPLIYSPSLYAAVYPLWQLAVFIPMFALFRPSPTEPDREKLEWATFLFALLLLSPVPSIYHFVVMVLSMVLLVDVLLRRKELKLAAIAIALYLLISTIDLWPTPENLSFALVTLLAFKRFWIELLLFALFLICVARIRAHRTTSPTGRGRTALLAAGSALILISSIAGYHRHFAHIHQDIARDLQPPASSYLATDPHPSPSGTLFTAMVPDGYRILTLPSNRTAPEPKAPNAPDQLTFAIAPDNSVLLELADATGSRIVRATEASLTQQSYQGILNATTLIPNAESPAISPDGQTIAFIRETKGRGALWLTHADGTNTTQAVDDAYNVYTASILRSGDLIFTARHASTKNRLSLYRATPNQPPRLISTPGEEIASFAFSPDESLLAVTRLQQNRWQLVLLNPTTHNQTNLTFGDCNAYTPAWTTPINIVYATDCGRGLALNALATIAANPTP